MRISAHDFDHAFMDWSVVIRDARSGDVLFQRGGDTVLKAASLGKLILLAFVGNELLRDPGRGDVLLHRCDVAPVADSGVWQHLGTDTLPLADVAGLVFMASDNLATNALLHHFGLEKVRVFRRELGFVDTDLLDVVRDERGPDDAPTLSLASAGELCEFMIRVAQDRLVSPGLSAWLRAGLSLNMDLSMVPAPLGLDPLAPRLDDSIPVANKTGADIGIRADAGLIGNRSRKVAYAAICNYDEERIAAAEALAGMHAIGAAIRSTR